MTKDEAKALIERSDVHQVIVGVYGGAYSLGVGNNNAGEVALIFRREGNSNAQEMSIIIDGKPVDVVVKFGFKAPVPMGSS